MYQLIQFNLTKQLLTVFLIIFTSGNISAKNKAFKLPLLEGKVTDSKTGEPIIGAAISLDFKKSGIITDSTGTYSIYLPSGEYIIKVSHVGYAFSYKNSFKSGLSS
jgi:CarboxypepD_reg-like domain